jgi:hypothetical protein
LEVVLVNTSSSYKPFPDDVDDILGTGESVSSPEKRVEITAPEPPSKRVRYTRGCPACESGMEAPGIRHNAACKRATASTPEVEISDPEPDDAVMEGSTEGLAVDTEFGRVTRAKRSSDQPLEDLEKEMKEEVERSKPRVSALLQDVADLAVMATDPDEPIRDLPLFSIKFATNATGVAVPFGTLHIRIWEPEARSIC